MRHRLRTASQAPRSQAPRAPTRRTGAPAEQRLIQRIALDDRADPLGQLGGSGVVFRRQRGREDAPDLGEVLELQAPGGQRGRADAQARGLHRRTRVERHRVAVDRDVDLRKPVLGLSARQRRLGVAQVDEHQVHVGAAGEHVDAVARLQELARQRPGAGHRAALALGEQLAGGDPEGHGLGRDDVLERPALLPGEHRRVDLLGVLLLAQDDPGAGTAERLVGGRGDDVGAVLDRAGVQPGGDETGEVGHVDHQQRADLVGDLAKAREVELARIGRPARQQQLRTALAGDAGDLVHVDQAAVAVDLVGGDLIQPAGDVDLHAVGEVAAVGEREPHDRVPRLEQRVVDGGVGLRAGVRLDVGVLGPEQRLGAVDGQLLGDVHPLAAAVVAAARVALGVLVGEHRALAFEHRPRDEVLRGDHLERALLALELAAQDLGDLRIDLRERAVEVVGAQLGHGALLGRR